MTTASVGGSYSPPRPTSAATAASTSSRNLAADLQRRLKRRQIVEMADDCRVVLGLAAPAYPNAPGECILVANSIDPQVTRIAAAAMKLMVDEQVAPEEFAVLVVRDQKQPIYEALRAKPLPRGVQWVSNVTERDTPSWSTLFSRFNGLEACIVFLCGMETVSEELDGELAYVGISRAKSRIILIGSKHATSQSAGQPHAP
jgi:hypothetical protein